MIGIEVYPEIEKTKMFKHLFFYDNICMKTLKAVFCFWSLRYYSLHNKWIQLFALFLLQFFFFQKKNFSLKF